MVGMVNFKSPYSSFHAQIARQSDLLATPYTAALSNDDRIAFPERIPARTTFAFPSTRSRPQRVRHNRTIHRIPHNGTYHCLKGGSVTLRGR